MKVVRHRQSLPEFFRCHNFIPHLEKKLSTKQNIEVEPFAEQQVFLLFLEMVQLFSLFLAWDDSIFFLSFVGKLRETNFPNVEFN
jgi:hypothetical protein